MQKFFLGFVSGVLAISGVFVAVQLSREPLSPVDSEQSFVALKKTIDNTSKNEISIKASSQIQLKRQALQQRKVNIEGSDESVASEFSNQHLNSEKIKIKILSKVNALDDKSLYRLEHLIDGLNQKIPNELFAEENIDPEWALKKQTDLEYAFYDKSSLKDLGELDSIDCKSQHCLVRVTVPKRTKLNPSYFHGWANPVMVKIDRKNDNTDRKTLELYIQRED